MIRFQSSHHQAIKTQHLNHVSSSRCYFTLGELIINIFQTTTNFPLLSSWCDINSSFFLILCSNLTHNLIIIFINFLYMFRTILCSSSGGFIVYKQHLVLCMSLFLGDRSVHSAHIKTHKKIHSSF